MLTFGIQRSTDMRAGKTALVVGANGGIGRAACLALRRHGWAVRGLVRHPPARRGEDGIDWVRGDAMNAEQVVQAAAGVQLIVHAVNPPGYRGWAKVVLPMLDSTLAAARASDARIVLPGTIYNFGPDAFPNLTEASPQHPHTAKGAIRAEMERRLRAAADDGVRTLILRCGDFFGCSAGNSWMTQGLIRPGRPVKALHYPGRPDIAHAWAYLPDVVETLARLVGRDSDLGAFEVFHFGGYWLDGHALLEAMRRASGNAPLRLAGFPWWLVTLAAPFNETLRELRRMRYLWREPLRLDDTRLRAFLGEVPSTPLDRALREALVAAACLPPGGPETVAHGAA